MQSGQKRTDSAINSATKNEYTAYVAKSMKNLSTIKKSIKSEDGGVNN